MNSKVIQDLKDSERDQKRQLDNLNQQLILKNSELDRAKGKIETLSNYNQTLEKEMTTYRNKVSQLNNDMHNE